MAGDGHVHQPLHFRQDPSQVPGWMTSINEKIKTSDAMVVVTPEYNCGLPPALSSIMDQFPPASYRHKPCGIVSYSMGRIEVTIMIYSKSHCFHKKRNYRYSFTGYNSEKCWKYLKDQNV